MTTPLMRGLHCRLCPSTRPLAFQSDALWVWAGGDVTPRLEESEAEASRQGHPRRRGVRGGARRGCGGVEEREECGEEVRRRWRPSVELTRRRVPGESQPLLPSLSAPLPPHSTQFKEE
ncbi:unnamed protein product [Arctogadus glacialis]